jgi:hypothetical protein
MPRIIRMKKAGTEAITHLTMKKTIDRNGILMSVTVTPLVS